MFVEYTIWTGEKPGEGRGGRRRQGATGPVPMACHWYICIKMQEKIYAFATIDGKAREMIYYFYQTYDV